MKNVFYVILCLLLLWNTFLTIEIFSNKNNDGQIHQTIIENTINGYTTDITEVVAKCESKVVTINTYSDGVLNKQASGIIYESGNNNVLIVTNEHVIANSEVIKVCFDNGYELEANVVGSDHISDVALLSVQTDFSVTAFTKGDSSILKKGEYVIAIGSPLGKDYAGSISLGVVSANNVVIGIDENNDNMDDYELVLIQTDATMNAGNSGGALINISGELLGLNTLGLDGNNVKNMNFAIPINELNQIVSQLKENGSVQRVYLGVNGVSVSDLEVYQKSYYDINIETNEGYLVKEVDEDSPAFKAGIMSGDIIIRLDGTSINIFNDLRLALYKYDVYDTIHLTYLRNNEQQSVAVVLE